MRRRKLAQKDRQIAVGKKTVTIADSEDSLVSDVDSDYENIKDR